MDAKDTEVSEVTCTCLALLGLLCFAVLCRTPTTTHGTRQHIGRHLGQDSGDVLCSMLLRLLTGSGTVFW
jgi:hypothetical protein